MTRAVRVQRHSAGFIFGVILPWYRYSVVIDDYAWTAAFGYWMFYYTRPAEETV